MNTTKINKALTELLTLDHGQYVSFSIVNFPVVVFRASQDRERTVYSLTGRDYKLFDVSFLDRRTFVLHPVGHNRNYLGREIARRLQIITGADLHE